MKIKSQLIYSINKIFFFGRRLPDYVKRIIVAVAKVLPSFIRQSIKQKKLFKYLFAKVFASGHTPRVYIKRGIGRIEFFEILNGRKIEYVLLRWWEDFPEIPYDEDMDILIKDEHRDLIDDLITFYDNGSGIKADVYTISGVNYGSYTDIPYFQSNLAYTLINARILFKGVY